MQPRSFWHQTLCSIRKKIIAKVASTFQIPVLLPWQGIAVGNGKEPRKSLERTLYLPGLALPFLRCIVWSYLKGLLSPNSICVAFQQELPFCELSASTLHGKFFRAVVSPAFANQALQFPGTEVELLSQWVVWVGWIQIWVTRKSGQHSSGIEGEALESDCPVLIVELQLSSSQVLSSLGCPFMTCKVEIEHNTYFTGLLWG